MIPQPIPFRTTRYRCPFCGRTGSHRVRIAAHIGRCWLNPAVRSCRTCDHYEPGHDACGCVAGCNWGSSGHVPPSCDAGCAVPDNGFPRVDCPKWSKRIDEEVTR